MQIFAAEPEALARGAEVAVRAGAGIIDVNMACPVKKVCGTGAGAALGREPAPGRGGGARDPRARSRCRSR